MSDFTPKDAPNFGGLDYEDAESRPADRVILRIPPDNMVPVGQDVQPGQTASAQPNQENVLGFELFVEKQGSWTKFTAQSQAPIEFSSVHDMGEQAQIVINGGPPQPVPAEPTPPPPGI